jgi:hypothetical protein
MTSNLPPKQMRRRRGAAYELRQRAAGLLEDAQMLDGWPALHLTVPDMARIAEALGISAERLTQAVQHNREPRHLPGFCFGMRSLQGFSHKPAFCTFACSVVLIGFLRGPRRPSQWSTNCRGPWALRRASRNANAARSCARQVARWPSFEAPVA